MLNLKLWHLISKETKHSQKVKVKLIFKKGYHNDTELIHCYSTVTLTRNYEVGNLYFKIYFSKYRCSKFIRLANGEFSIYFTEYWRSWKKEKRKKEKMKREYPKHCI